MINWPIIIIIIIIIIICYPPVLTRGETQDIVMKHQIF